MSASRARADLKHTASNPRPPPIAVYARDVTIRHLASSILTPSARVFATVLDSHTALYPMDLLVLALDHESYAIPVSAVCEVVRAVAVTRLPGAPSVIEGVVDVRGVVLPVFDLRRRFGLPAREIALDHVMVVVRTAGRMAMLRLDRAVGVRTIQVDGALMSRDLLPRSPFFAGLARLDDGVVLIHDVESFLSEAESTALDEALAAAATMGDAA